jgi:DNA-binding protein H-NS
MAKTLESIQAQIEKLQQQARALRAKEAVGVIARIKEAIAVYEFTPEDLFGAPSTAKAAKATDKKPAAAKKKAKKAATFKRAIKYTDGTNSWVGHGKRPKWFVDALAAGKTSDDMLVGQKA